MRYFDTKQNYRVLKCTTNQPIWHRRIASDYLTLTLCGTQTQHIQSNLSNSSSVSHQLLTGGGNDDNVRESSMKEAVTVLERQQLLPIPSTSSGFDHVSNSSKTAPMQTRPSTPASQPPMLLGNKYECSFPYKLRVDRPWLQLSYASMV